MKVIIVDDHELIREGIKKVIAKEFDIEIAGEATNIDELFIILRATNDIDVIILDISLPGRSGIDVIKDIKIEAPNTAILILSMHPENRFAVRALKAGAAGYITKGNASKSLVKALRKVYDGRKYISPTLAEYLASELDVDYDKPLHENLSNREFEVMKLIAEGKSVSEIADMLCLSVNTVTTYRSRVMGKMNMDSNAELVRYALEHNIIV
jgi:DNA-binding NarL/FixJ family response regulator